MKAVIMAGGLGTRLRPLTYLLPKPMVPVLNRPLLEHTFHWLKQAGIHEIIILLHYMPDVIRDHFGSGHDFDMAITYVEAKKDFSTAGAVRLASAYLDESFLVISGDIICDLPIPDLISFHNTHNGPATIALTSVPDPSPFGIVDVDSSGRVRRFTEKPASEQVFGRIVNMGVYVLRPEIFKYIPADREFYFARHVFPDLLEKGAPFSGLITNCYWLDIGNIHAYKQAQIDAIRELISLEPPYPFEHGISMGKNCHISRRVSFAGKVVIGDDCRIDEGVALCDTVIGNGCRINAGVRLTNCTVWKGLEIQKNREFSSTVFASSVTEI